MQKPLNVLKHAKGKTPVIVITGGSESKLQTKILTNLWCKAIVTKPFKSEAIFHLIEKFATDHKK